MAALEGVEISPAPAGLAELYDVILSEEAVRFVTDMAREFRTEVDQMFLARIERRLRLRKSDDLLPTFDPDTEHIRSGDWAVDHLPERLLCRQVDVGDVSPADMSHLKAALQSQANGVQVDFDDGHCPIWSNQIRGLHNIYDIVHGSAFDLSTSPILMIRPRAWNMPERNLSVDGKPVSGSLFDFALIMFHNARDLCKKQAGPFLYLSKLEGYREARLWDQIFTWSETKLKLDQGSIKACVLIENVLAAFETHEILYELRHHAIGLNCGMWDYCASIIALLGHRSDFVLPDRGKYVNMKQEFLKHYMNLVVKTCHQRRCLATGGMASPVIPDDKTGQVVIDKVTKAKSKEIEAGVDGFLVFDLKLIQPLQELFKRMTSGRNQMDYIPDVSVTPDLLLVMPQGGITRKGISDNITVGVFFIEAWLRGQGSFVCNGAAEDSATADISRSQIWQWLWHNVRMEDQNHTLVTKKFVCDVIAGIVRESRTNQDDKEFINRIGIAAKIFEEMVCRSHYDEFITSYLYEHFTMATSDF